MTSDGSEAQQPDQTQSRLEEVSRCPKCKQSGRETQAIRAGRKGVVHTYLCENQLCLWFNTTWIVQVRPDGTIPDREKGPKQFEPITPGQAALSEREFEMLRREGLA